MMSTNGSRSVSEELLAEQLAAVQEVWAESVNHMLSLVGPRMEALQKEAIQHAETEAYDLRIENKSLRARLSMVETSSEGAILALTPQEDCAGVASLSQTAMVDSSETDLDTEEFRPSSEFLTETQHFAADDDSFEDSSEESFAPSTPPGGRGPGGQPCLENAISKQPLSEAFPQIATPQIPGTANKEAEKALQYDSEESMKRAPSEKSILCICGNKFLNDAIWCRKCGKHRPGVCSCGNTLVADAEFCNICGIPREQAEQENRKSNLIRSTQHMQQRKSRVDKDHTTFANAEAMKKEIRLAIAKKEYNVCDFYWKVGIGQKVARHPAFEITTLCVIAANALWISIDADHNDATLLNDAHPIFQVAEHSFCLYFFVEWLFRFSAFQSKWNCKKDAWFVFDTALLGMMIIETWIISIVVAAAGSGTTSGLGGTSVFKLVRLIRLTRMARMAKLLRAVPELVILVKGVFVASRSVIFTFLLLMVLIYFFAVIFNQMSRDLLVHDKYFSSIPASMTSLLLDGVLPDQALFIKEVAEESLILGLFSFVFILVASLTIMNMLIGILVEVINVVSIVEKEQLTVSYVKEQLVGMFKNEEMTTITKDEFLEILQNPKAAKIIQGIGVDVETLVDFEDFIFNERDKLTFGDFMDLVLQLRGSNNCTVKDIANLRKSICKDTHRMHDELLYSLNGLPNRLEHAASQIDLKLERAPQSKTLLKSSSELALSLFHQPMKLPSLQVCDDLAFNGLALSIHKQVDVGQLVGHKPKPKIPAFSRRMRNSDEQIMQEDLVRLLRDDEAVRNQLDFQMDSMRVRPVTAPANTSK